APWGITPLLMIGGAFLCFEGFEKLAHKFLHSHAEDEAHHTEHVKALADPAIDLVALEKEKIAGAVRTDFILSAEIIAITLGTVEKVAFGTQVAVLVGIALIMTVGVYGLVGGIVKLDDAGIYLNKQSGTFQRRLGQWILLGAPYLMKGLSIAGTAAMFLVGGGILVHGIPGSHDLIHIVEHHAHGIPVVGGILAKIVPMLLDAVIGIIAGALILGCVRLIGKVMKGKKKASQL
ncbi:MAG TPA: DUF808 family protein, partial [Acidobacteriota bacterium]|nr:DUF808 family protein [Acidobacteriota bacterium]